MDLRKEEWMWEKSEEEKLREEKDKKVLKILSRKLTKTQYKELINCDHFDGAYDFEIITMDKVEGQKQMEDEWFKYVYVKQSSYEDSYWGTVSIPINDTEYLKFRFCN